MKSNEWISVYSNSNHCLHYIRKDTITSIKCENTYINCYACTVISDGKEFNISGQTYAKLMKEIDPNWKMSTFYQDNHGYSKFPS